VGLADEVLGGVPGAAEGGRRALVLEVAIGAGGELRNGALHEAALLEARAHERRVHQQQDPRPALEQHRRPQQPEPQEHLQHRHQRHARVVVVLDEAPDRVGEPRRLWLLACWCGRLRRLEGRQEIRARVGRDVEDRVDGERKNGERHLAREEPDQGHA